MQYHALLSIRGQNISFTLVYTKQSINELHSLRMSSIKTSCACEEKSWPTRDSKKLVKLHTIEKSCTEKSKYLVPKCYTCKSKLYWAKSVTGWTVNVSVQLEWNRSYIRWWKILVPAGFSFSFQLIPLLTRNENLDSGTPLLHLLNQLYQTFTKWIKQKKVSGTYHGFTKMYVLLSFSVKYI